MTDEERTEEQMSKGMRVLLSPHTKRTGDEEAVKSKFSLPTCWKMAKGPSLLCKGLVLCALPVCINTPTNMEINHPPYWECWTPRMGPLSQGGKELARLLPPAGQQRGSAGRGGQRARESFPVPTPGRHCCRVDPQCLTCRDWKEKQIGRNPGKRQPH